MARKTGLWRTPTRAAMESAVRTCRRPPQMARLPRHVPLSRLSGRQPHQHGDILDGALTQFRPVGEYRQRDRGADPGHTAQQLLPFAPQRARAQQLVQFPIQLLERLLQPGDVFRGLGTHWRQSLLQAILLRPQHAHHLVTPLDQGREPPGRLGPRRAPGGDGRRVGTVGGILL